MRIVEDTIIEVTKRLLRGHGILYYKDRSYLIETQEFVSPVDLNKRFYISIKPEFRSMLHNPGDIYFISYGGLSQSEIDTDKAQACFKLATKFVRTELPKVDWEIREELHNREIERTLAVLD